MSEEQERRLHAALTGDGALAQADLGQLYQRRVRQVQELLTRLREVDPRWTREWEQKESRR